MSHFNSIDFFSFLNQQAMMKNKRTKKSMSLAIRHKKSKYAAISHVMGEKEPQEILEKIGVIYREGNEKLQESKCCELNIFRSP